MSDMPPIDVRRLRDHVSRLARTPRPAQSAALVEARDYVDDCLTHCGWTVERHEFVATNDMGAQLRGINLIARNERHPLGVGPRLCVGAHLDSTTESPGADDNASAVAALLEIARVLPDCWPEQPALDLELVAFDLEEWGMLGGAEHAQLCRRENIDLRGMVALEMLGYCDARPGSQALPRSLLGKYPDTGDWIAIIGNQNSGTLIEQFRIGMTRVPGLPVETLQVPDNGNLLQATRLSDHSPFWDAGYPALMITDTAFLRNPHYHQRTDTPETLDYDFLERVTQGCLEAVRHLLG